MTVPSRAARYLLIPGTILAFLLTSGAALASTGYTVRTGDTLSSIAAAHRVSLRALEAANQQFAGNWNMIFAGQAVAIPGAGVTAAPGRDHEPDGDGDDPVSPAAAPAAGGGSTAIPAWAACIVTRESGGNPRAVNQILGGAAGGGGLFGDLTSTWGGYGGYSQPYDAPVSVQIAMNNQLSGNGSNLAPWAADGCPGT